MHALAVHKYASCTLELVDFDAAIMTGVTTSAVIAIDATDAASSEAMGIGQDPLGLLMAISLLGSADGIIIYNGRYLVMYLLSSPSCGNWTRNT